MSGNALMGNIDMAWMAPYFREQGAFTGVDMTALDECIAMAPFVFGIGGSGH